MKRKGVTLFIILAILGIAIGGYLTHLHFSNGASFCDRVPGFDCGTVNRGAYAEFPPWTFTWWIDRGLPTIPNAVMAIGAFIAMIALVTWSIKTKNPVTEHKVLKLTLVLVTIGFLFGLWLIWVQYHILQLWCLLCITLDYILLMMELSMRQALGQGHGKLDKVVKVLLVIGIIFSLWVIWEVWIKALFA